MRNGMNKIENDGNAKRAWVAPLSDEWVEDPMHTRPSKNDCENYEDDTKVMATIAISKINVLIEEETDFIYAGRTQAQVAIKLRKPSSTSCNLEVILHGTELKWPLSGSSDR